MKRERIDAPPPPTIVLAHETSTKGNLMAEEFAGPTTASWVTTSALIAILREEGVLSEAALDRLFTRMRRAADKYAEAGHPADAADIRRDADILQAGSHTTASDDD